MCALENSNSQGLEEQVRRESLEPGCGCDCLHCLHRYCASPPLSISFGGSLFLLSLIICGALLSARSVLKSKWSPFKHPPFSADSRGTCDAMMRWTWHIAHCPTLRYPDLPYPEEKCSTSECGHSIIRYHSALHHRTGFASYHITFHTPSYHTQYHVIPYAITLYDTVQYCII